MENKSDLFVIQFDAETQIMNVIQNGVYEIGESTKMIEYFSKLMLTNNCRKVLIDNKNGSIKANTIDIYNRPKKFEKAGLPRNIKVAILYGEQNEQERFYETVLKNRGYNFRNFKHPEEAMKWLQR